MLGGGRVHCKIGNLEGGSWTKVRIRAGKIASDVELWSFFFLRLVIEKKKLLWTPYVKPTKAAAAFGISPRKTLDSEKWGGGY